MIPIVRLIVLLSVITLAGRAGEPASSASTGGVHLYVSPLGDDGWTGAIAFPNRNRTDGPLATLERAREILRERRAHGELARGATVEIRDGTYALRETFRLTAADSGAPDGPIIWRAHGREAVVLTGGKGVDGFRPVTETGVLARLTPEAREHVVVADLRAQGVTAYGEITPRGAPPMELFYHGARMTPARYPNTGWLTIADVPQTGDSLYNEGLAREKRYDGVPAGRHYGRIAYSGDRPARWRMADDIYLHGYWTFDWSDSYQRVASIDTARKEITLRAPHHGYGYTKNQRYYAMNVLEELDTPGEWYLDRARGFLYFWPPSPLARGSAFVSLLDSPLVSLGHCPWVDLEGLTLAYSRGDGIDIIDSRHVAVERCLFHALGRDAVVVDGGAQVRVASCEIREVGLGGIKLKGGNRKTLEPGGHTAENNHIHDYSRWLRTGQYAVVLDGVGQRAAHNLIHDSPFEGMYLRGNDHLIEYNEFHHLMQETGDAGAIHTGRDWTWRGNVIRYNYLHDLKGPGLHGVMGVYLDDFSCGFRVYGNLFYRAGRATLIGGGRDNVVENNLYIECSPSVHLDARGLGWASYYYDGSRRELFDQMDDVRYNKPPYSERYPELLRMYDGESGIPKYNRIERNISYGGRWMDVYDFQAFDFSVVTVKDNLIGDPVVLRKRKDGEKGWDPYYINIDMHEGYEAIGQADVRIPVLFRGNIFVDGNPGVASTARGRFRVDPAAAARIGFKPIPVEKIGLSKGSPMP